MSIETIKTSRNHALVEYHTILKQKCITSDFQSMMVLMIEKFPYFIPPYSEMLELFEASDNHEEYAGFASITYERLHRILFTSNSTLVEVLSILNFEELFALQQLVTRLETHYPNSPLRVYRLMHAKKILNERLSLQSPPTSKEHLVCVKNNVDTFGINKEMLEKEHLWYANTKRQRDLMYHSHTQSIVLRSIVDRAEYPTSIDGPHESIRTPCAHYFKQAITFAEECARESKCGLGRVALVRLKSGKISYRHADHETHLQNRTRYHLVVDAKKDNLLCVGDELAFIENGQLFKYDNKVMHKSYNQSPDWRVHLIFDMFPVKQYP